MALLSILALYNEDNTIFHEMKFPANVVPKTLWDTILLECAEFEVIYPDPEFMKMAIGVWSETRLAAWQKLSATTVLDYNPIWNKDGKITETETISRGHTTEGTVNENSTATGTSSHTANVSDNGGGDETNYISAFDANDFTNHDKKVITNRNIEQTTESGNSNDSTISASNSKTEGTENGTVSRERIEQGNIGVTTTQQMIKEEREVSKFDMYSYIADEFKQRFCIMVY